jgi:hypothetical protein
VLLPCLPIIVDFPAACELGERCMHGLEIVFFYFCQFDRSLLAFYRGVFLTADCCSNGCVGGGRFATLAEAAALPV